MSFRTLTYIACVIRRHSKKIGSCWRMLSPGRQALLVLAQLRKGETFADQAAADLITLANKGYHGAGDHVLTPYRGRNKPAANPAAG